MFFDFIAKKVRDILDFSYRSTRMFQSPEFFFF